MAERTIGTGEFVKITIDGFVGTLELHRPPVNALNQALGTELVDAVEALEATEVRAVILTGGQRMFSAGFDIKQLERSEPSDAIGRNRRMYRIYRSVEQARFPVIAAINGYAIGGSCQLVLACDFRVMAADAFLSWPEIDLAGLAPMQRLIRTIGYGHARRLVYTAARCYGEEAFRLGLANVLAGPGQAIPLARRYAELIAEKPPHVVEAGKSAMTMGVEVPVAAAQLAELALAGEIAGSPVRRGQLDDFGHGVARTIGR